MPGKLSGRQGSAEMASGILPQSVRNGQGVGEVVGVGVGVGVGIELSQGIKSASGQPNNVSK
ncbi:MAG TPA: hypothetical protein VGB17_16065 [Pyrinomonadaceae bacterium]